MSSAFELATTLTRVTDDSFSACIPDHWQQGRGAFGGLVLGVLARAMLSAEPDTQRVLRSLLGDLCGPVLPGPASVRVQRLRRGNNVSNLDAQFSVERLPRPVATVSFAAQLLADVSALDPRVPLFHRAEVTTLQDGFFVEMRQLWSGATLVAMNQQTLALLK